MKPCKAQNFTEWSESVKARAVQNPGWFGKYPVALLLDKSVSSDAKVLFGILAAKTYKTQGKSNVVSVSTRELAVLFTRSAPTISTWIGQLVQAGHLERISPRKAKSVLRLTSPVFEYSMRVETAPNAVADIDSGHAPMLRDKKRRCPKCRQVRHISSTSGVCDGCLSEWINRTA